MSFPVFMMSESLQAEAKTEKPEKTNLRASGERRAALWPINLVAVNVLRLFPPFCVQSVSQTSCSVIYNRRRTSSLFLRALSSCYFTVYNKTVRPSSTRGGGVYSLLMVPIIGLEGGAGAR